MSKTPRTDNNIAFTDYAVCGDPLVYTYASFSRQLESELVEKDRQLAEARAEIERLKRCCNCEYANHKFEICEHPDNEPETFMDGVCDLWSHNI